MIKYLRALRGSFSAVGSIDSNVVRTYFNKTQSLMFDGNSAELEQHAVARVIEGVPRKRILDLGCGDGRYAKAIPSFDYYQGVDFCEAFIGSCEGKSNQRFVCADVTNYLTEERFNIILVIGLITYLDDDCVIKLSRNIKKMMAEDAIVILRSVTLKRPGFKKLYYDESKLQRFLRPHKPRYQIIRRSPEYELRLFEGFYATSVSEIPGTSYTLYTLKEVE